jgi:predicted transcriptional regulator
MEVFSTNIFHVVPIATDDNNLIGMLHMEDVGQIYMDALSAERSANIM